MATIGAPPAIKSIFQFPPNFPNGTVSDVWMAWFQTVQANTYNYPAPVAGYALGWDSLGNIVNVPNTGADQYATLADTTLATNGAGRIGYNGALAYGASTVGAELNTLAANFGNYTTTASLVSNFVSKAILSDTTNPANGASLVGYLAPYTGAVATDQATIDNETISVFRFMTPAQIADVTAGTLLIDVTSALQAAINAAQYRELTWMHGKYLIGTGINTDGLAALSFKTNSTYRGATKAVTTTVGGATTDNGVVLVWGGGDHGTMVEIVNTWGVSVTGISLVGNYDGNTHPSSNVVGYDLYTLGTTGVASHENYLGYFSVEKCAFGVAFGFALGANHNGGNMDGWIVERFSISNVNYGFYLNSINIYYSEIKSGSIAYFGAGVWFAYSGTVSVDSVVGYGMDPNGLGTKGLFIITDQSGQLFFKNCQHQPSGYEVTPYTFATFSGATKNTPTTFMGCNIESVVNIASPQTHLTFIGNEIPSVVFANAAAAGSSIISLNDHLGASTGFIYGGFQVQATLSGSSMTLTANTLIGNIIVGSVQYAYGTGIPANTKVVSLTSGAANTAGAVYLLSNPVTTVSTPEIVTGAYTLANYPGVDISINGSSKGNWTASVYQGATLIGSTIGSWVKTGKMVEFEFMFSGSTPVAGSGLWQVQGLPFPRSTTGIQGLAQVGNFTLNGTEYSMSTPYWGGIVDGATTVLLYGNQNTAVWSSSSMAMQMTGSYPVD